MITPQEINAHLRGFYATSRRLTPQIIDEMTMQWNVKEWSLYDFKEAVRLYREQSSQRAHPPQIWELVAKHHERMKPKEPPFRHQELRSAPRWFVEAGKCMAREDWLGYWEAPIKYGSNALDMVMPIRMRGKEGLFLSGGSVTWREFYEWKIAEIETQSAKELLK